MNTQTKKLKWILVPIAAVTMGVSMPSCPGQQALQQQVDSLQTTNADLSKKVQALSSQVTTLTNDMNQVKQILPQVTGLITSQKTTLDQLDAAVKDMQKSKGGAKKKK